MKIQKKIVEIELTLVLNAKEVAWLHEAMSVPIGDLGEPESQEEADMRNMFYDATEL